MVAFIGATVGGAVGWWAGAFIGVMTGFFLSVVGMAVGIYLARRWVARLME